MFDLVFFLLVLKIIKCVFLTFKESLFAESQEVIFRSSWFIVLTKTSAFLWLKNRFVSSAKRINDKIFEHFEISSI